MEVEQLNSKETMAGAAANFLATNIRCLRKRQGLSQDELAQKIGLNRGNIASYEKSSAEPKICNLLKMSKLFEVSVRDLSEEDLSNEQLLAKAKEAYRLQHPDQFQHLAQFKEEAGSIESYLQGIHTCCLFKMNAMQDTSSDLEVLKGYYQQMQEAADHLLQQHKSLIDFVSCRK